MQWVSFSRRLPNSSNSIQEQEEKPDYAEEAASELDKIMQKAAMLTEMLNDVKPGEVIGRGDIFEVRRSNTFFGHVRIWRCSADTDEYYSSHIGHILLRSY